MRDETLGPAGEARQSNERIKTYDAFFAFYLREHAKPLTRHFHYAGTIATLVLVAFAILTGRFVWLLLLPIVGYGPAWISHAFVERNQPATFRYPLWSLISDYRMTWLWVTGRMPRALEKAGMGAQ